jgi:NitT/TauT family transport system ATP-binding protein
MEEDSAHLPNAGISTIFGLLEVLDDLKGEEDVYKLAQSLNYELDDMLPVIEAAEMFGFVAIKKGDIAMTSLGKEFVEEDVDGRKRILRDRLLNHPVFREIVELLAARKEHRTSRSSLIERFETRFSPEESERQLHTVIDWGRYAELIGYNSETEELYLSED